MDFTKRFKALNLHGDAGNEDEYEKRPFALTAKIQQDLKKPIYGCAFNPYVNFDEVQMVATVADKFLYVYDVPKDVNNLVFRWSCEFPTEKLDAISLKCDDRQEGLYTVTWCYDTYEAENDRNPYKVAVAGVIGHIYIVDSVSRQLSNRLTSVGGEINDIRTSPANSSLIAVASSDQSVRIHHIRNESCLIVIGGLYCHAGSILSVDWATNGNYLLTCGFDHQVMKWDLSVPAVKEHLDRACEILRQGEINCLSQKQEIPGKGVPKKQLKRSTLSEEEQEKENVLKLHLEEGARVYSSCLLPIYAPSCVSSDLHDNYVDCVRALPGTDYILSKGCGVKEGSIHLWRFGLPKDVTENKSGSVRPQMTSTVKLLSYKVPAGDNWFAKFAIDPKGRWLVNGTGEGSVSFYDMRKMEDHRPVMHIRTNPQASVVRQISFSACGRIVVAVVDGGYVCRFDRVPSTVDTKELAKF